MYVKFFKLQQKKYAVKILKKRNISVHEGKKRQRICGSNFLMGQSTQARELRQPHRLEVEAET